MGDLGNTEKMTQFPINGHNDKPEDARIWMSMRCMDQPRPLKLIYVGGGISGIIAAIEFINQVPELDMVIYEKNPELGGTWFENRYPGCACGKQLSPPRMSTVVMQTRLGLICSKRCSRPCISAYLRVVA